MYLCLVAKIKCPENLRFEKVNEKKNYHHNYKLVTGFWVISSRFLKVHVFGFIFSLKLSLRLKAVSGSITTLSSYFKCVLNKKIFDVDKIVLSMW